VGIQGFHKTVLGSEHGLVPIYLFYIVGVDDLDHVLKIAPFIVKVPALGKNDLARRTKGKDTNEEKAND